MTSTKKKKDYSIARTTTIVIDGPRRKPKSVFAVCVKSDDPDHLTLSKRLYDKVLKGLDDLDRPI